MVSLRGRIVKLFIRKFMSVNPYVNPNVVEKIRSTNPQIYKDLNISGYTFERKKAESGVEYVIIRKNSNKPAKKIIYYLHGGAYILKLNNMYETFFYSFCDLRDDIEIVLLDYYTAPEYKYPTQLNQATEVWDIITKEHKAEDIIVGGDSSGGNLALALIQKLKKERNIFPRAGFFLSPWSDMTSSGKSYYEKYRKDVYFGESNKSLTKEKLETVKNGEIYSFVGDADRKDPYVSPLYGDYSVFPKSLFIVGTDEVLLDDTLTIVDEIKKNKENDIDVLVKEGMFHVYPLFEFLPESKEAKKRLKNFVKETFNN